MHQGRQQEGGPGQWRQLWKKCLRRKTASLPTEAQLTGSLCLGCLPWAEPAPSQSGTRAPPAMCGAVVGSSLEVGGEVALLVWSHWACCCFGSNCQLHWHHLHCRSAAQFPRVHFGLGPRNASQAFRKQGKWRETNRTCGLSPAGRMDCSFRCAKQAAGTIRRTKFAFQ